ncbi:substrate-binding domain-containing protein [Ornithinimicrobium panacihumi]|uniref:substrate-binding domain-containing protein n=1 Tax=Ornithinimicrobium panacihumi TaxID=2008449 RepID=UPI003F89A095
MAKHSAPAQVSWGQKIGLALLALLLIAGAAGVYQLLTRGGGDDVADGTGDGTDQASVGQTDGAGDEAAATGNGDSASATGSDSADSTGAAGIDPADCGAVTVWVAPALASTAQAAAQRATDDCFTYDLVTRESAAAQSALRGGDQPDVWLADSTAWPQLLAECDVQLEVGEVIASSPVLLAGREGLVDKLGELGVGADTDWAGLMAAYQEVGGARPDAQVQLRVGDPRVDPASMAMLSTVGAQLAAAEPGSSASNLMVSLAQTAVQGDPLSATGATTLVPATEQQLGAAGEDDLRGVPLKGGIGVVEMPFVRVGDGASAPALDALEEALTSDEAAQDLADAWLRKGTDGEAPAVPGVPEGVTAEARGSDPAVATALAARWAVIGPQSRILTLIDISGSMDAPVGDSTRVDLTRAAAQTALSVLPEQTAIGLWYFATELDGDKDWEEQVPLRALNAEVRSGVTQKDVLLAETEKLTVDALTGDTGLHDALWAAYQEMSAEASPDSIASIVLLTDGINDDPPGGLSEKQVIERLEKARAEAEHEVTVVLIGMGDEPDEDALERLAKAAGGQSLVLRDPTQLPQVFVDVVARRAA